MFITSFYILLKFLFLCIFYDMHNTYHGLQINGLNVYNMQLCCCLAAISSLTLVAPGAAARQAPLCMGFSRQEDWSGLPCPPPGDLPNPRIKLRSPAWQVDSLPAKSHSQFPEVTVSCPLTLPHTSHNKEATF